MKTYAYLLIVLLCFGAACSEGDNADEGGGGGSEEEQFSLNSSTQTPDCSNVFAEKVEVINPQISSTIKESPLPPEEVVSINDVDGNLESFVGSLGGSSTDEDGKEITQFVVNREGSPPLTCDGNITKDGENVTLSLSCGDNSEDFDIDCDAEYSL